MNDPTCYLSFPDDEGSATVAERLRTHLERLKIKVLPPGFDDGSGSGTTMSSFYWLRVADAVVLDMTGDSTWVTYEAGAAKALNKTLIPIVQPAGAPSAIRVQLGPILEYDPTEISTLAEYVQAQVLRGLVGRS